MDHWGQYDSRDSRVSDVHSQSNPKELIMKNYNIVTDYTDHTYWEALLVQIEKLFWVS